MALTDPSEANAKEGGLRLGIFGGTFDPIHIGHLIVAEEARAYLHLNRVIFVPARVSPFKLQGTAFSPEDRFHMVELAIQDNPYFAASRVDIDRQGPSFTVDTLRAMHRQYGPQAQLFFIMGADSLQGMGAWRAPEEIIRLAQLIAISRPGFRIDMRTLEQKIPGISQVTHIIDTLQLGISSTNIRNRLRQGLPIKYQVPAPVEAYIYSHNLVKELGQLEHG